MSPARAPDHQDPPDAQPGVRPDEPGPSGRAGPAPNYEQARDELVQVVSRLEAGGLSLDDSLTLWERGEHLAAECARFLDGARERVASALARTEQPDG